MKAFALAVAVVAGVLFSAGTADAQYRYRGGTSYGYTYGYPTYTYPVYSYAPSYYSGYSGVVTSGYTPYVSSGVVTAGYTPAYSYDTFYPTSYYPSTFYSGTPYSGSYYGSNYYGGYNRGVYISPSGGNWRGRGWRW